MVTHTIAKFSSSLIPGGSPTCEKSIAVAAFEEIPKGKGEGGESNFCTATKHHT